MSTLLKGFDLIKLEENLRKEVSERFGNVVWILKNLLAPMPMKWIMELGVK